MTKYMDVLLGNGYDINQRGRVRVTVGVKCLVLINT